MKLTRAAALAFLAAFSTLFSQVAPSCSSPRAWALSVGVSVTFGVAFLVLSSIPIYLLAGLAALDGAAAP